MYRTLSSLLLLAASLGLTGCASTGDNAAQQAECRNCGEITAIDTRRLVDDGSFARSLGSTSDGGRILEFPDLSSLPTLGTALSNPNGGLAGAAPTVRSVDLVSLQMDDGSQRRVAVDSARRFRIGERVKLVGNQLLPAPIGSSAPNNP